ncbi:MAG: hypothetical protein WKF91_16285 [Segetibacter sp.]
MYTKEQFFQDLSKLDFIPEKELAINNVSERNLDSFGVFFQYVIGVTVESMGGDLHQYNSSLRQRIHDNNGKSFQFVNFRFEYNEKETAKEILQQLSKMYDVEMDADRLLENVKKNQGYDYQHKFHIVVSKIPMHYLQSYKIV